MSSFQFDVLIIIAASIGVPLFVYLVLQRLSKNIREATKP